MLIGCIEKFTFTSTYPVRRFKKKTLKKSLPNKSVTPKKYDGLRYLERKNVGNLRNHHYECH